MQLSDSTTQLLSVGKERTVYILIHLTLYVIESEFYGFSKVVGTLE